ncbi:MAG: hypothetical protein ACLQUY_15405 [Ktedonobacterales bacterium]
MKPTSRIPSEARRRMIAPAHAALDRLRRPGLYAVIPLSREGWQSVVADAKIADGVLRIATALSRCTKPGITSSAKLLRTAVRDTVDSSADIAENLWCLDAFDACDGRGVVLLDALVDVCGIGIDAAAGFATDLDVQGKWSEVEDLTKDLLAVERQYSFTEDPCQAAFGVPFESVRDAKGIFSGLRLLSAYYGRYSRLRLRINSVLSILTSSPPDLLNALRPAEALVLTDRPLVALRTAIRVRDLFTSKLAEDAEELARPLRAMKLEVDRSAISHAGIIRVVGQLEHVETAAERAALTLDLYRRMVESQLRPWAWTLLQIYGRSGVKAPELSSLREQLLSAGVPLLRDAAEAILSDPRNAAAHEDYLWDDELKMLRVGDGTVSVDDLEAAISRSYAFMAGAECAWRCARTESSELARLLDREDPQDGIRAINALRGLEHFGTNGISVRNWFMDGDVLTVLLDELPLSSINPCFQAVTWSSRHLTNVNRFIIKLPGQARPVMDLGRQPLDACFGVWREAIKNFSVMPTSVFLPANAWARLAVELPDQAMRAVAWFALNDARHAYLDAMEMPGPLAERIAPLNSRLHLIGTALAATITTLPIEIVEPLTEVLDLVTAAESWNLPATIGLSRKPAHDLEIRISELYTSYPVPAVLPTVDARPLDVMEAEGTNNKEHGS